MRQIFKLFLSVFLLIISSQNAFAKKNIAVLATGGTIAGSGSSESEVSYSAGKISIEDLLAKTSSLKKLANLKGEQLLQMSSENMNDEIWLKIARRVDELVNNSDVDGVVITHGTDTIEETAYFLDLTVRTKKPIILVGSMRPATSISSDGPLNLHNAIAVAANDAAKNKGVLVVFNDSIFDARSITKAHTSNVAAFQSPNFGPIGIVSYGDVKFYYEPLRAHTNKSEFNIRKIKSLPKVDILYGYAGFDDELVDNLVENGAKGIVFAGAGDGNIYKPALEKLMNLSKEEKVLVVRSSRTGAGYVIRGAEINDDENGFVNGDNLNAQKARILLKLALTKSDDWEDVQKIFDRY